MKSIYFYVIISITGLTSCKKFVENLRPADQLTTSEIFSDSTTAEAAMAGVYANQMTNYLSFYNEMAVICGLSADELNANAGSYYDWFRAFNENTILINDDWNLSFWTSAFKTIYQCNIIIQNAASSGVLQEEMKARLTGEAKFLRALTYFYLVNLYGDIPMPVSADYTANAQLARSPANSVYDLMIQDLTDARALLTDSYISSERIRANRKAAEALLARVYLYRGNWEQAAAEAGNVIQAPLYSLSDPAGTFIKSSGETILEIPPASSQLFGVADAYFFIPEYPSSIPNFSLADGLLHTFEQGDLRVTNWLDSNTVSGNVYYYPYKYKISIDYSTSKSEYNIVLRLAEMYLIQAEAFAQQGDLPASIQALDKVRQRAGLLRIADTDPGITRDNLLAKIYNEWRVEYFAEWGHRWLDLKRWGKADEALQPIKPHWLPAAQLFPIPWEEIKADVFLTQNEGYPSSL